MCRHRGEVASEEVNEKEIDARGRRYRGPSLLSLLQSALRDGAAMGAASSKKTEVWNMTRK
ncbi:hypothetical protein RGR602_PC02261 (plasmid) [Rhizobium gallicum bv. gallicum R602sp]|uniref:Uncharacterized protein n=1 Tax=Rhizobium gallicum bv. gallicum R602sp TaxID=1041138 RepID=A0A0B4XHQ0_9HYPH|nr:hypothetical protein RGR602_PC02261 [Rhizobium gallicum bv. gallicum R602sp]